MNQRVKPEATRRSENSPIRLLKFKLGVLALLCALPLYGLIAAVARGGGWWFLAIYPFMSLLAVGLYDYDKKQARVQGQRTPEKVLHGVELLGGWPGALIAQQLFRHKTRKVSYQLLFWLIVLLHELFWMDRVLLGGRFLLRHLY
jgi:uncharacterized membrane protein YsdA (DUF1294 family)